jgi:purine nucleosidase
MTGPSDSGPPRRILIDCDPGLDDAAALLMAFGAQDRLDITAVTTVAGNVGLAEVTRNAAGLLALAGRSAVPLHAGCPRALMPRPGRAAHVHGEDGIGGVALPDGPAVQPMHAVQAICEIARAHPEGGLTLVPTGPLTNIACALTLDPGIARHIDRIVLMGGAAFVAGNVTPAAEFNFATDPVAARIVLDSGLPVTVMGLDVTRQAVLTADRIAAIRAIGSAPATALADMLAAYRGRTGKSVLHDPCTIAWLLAPELFEGRRVAATVDTGSEISMGRLVADWHGVTDREPTVTIMTEMDDAGFYRLLTECVARV